MRKWMSAFFYRSRIYVYCPALIVFELVLRNGLHLTDAQTFIGPSIAVAGASSLIPLTLEKPLTPERLAKLPLEIREKLALVEQRQEISITLTKEKQFIGLCWAVILACTAAWFFSLFIALTQPDSTLLLLPLNYWPGIVVYLVSIAANEVREELI